MKQQDLIMGYGQVGQALGKILNCKNFLDPIKSRTFEGKCRVLNVCIPYSPKFIKDVQKAIGRYEPNLTIIHSTVPVGTSRKIGKKVVFSFVRGRHPKLTNMVQHIKHVGCADALARTFAIKYLAANGFRTTDHDNPEVVELGKLLDTTYYGVCIAYTKEAKKMADFYKLKWTDIAFMNKTYNLGYSNEGHPEFIRPELYPTEGPIGGHCVVANAKILKKTFRSKLLDAIIESK